MAFSTHYYAIFLAIPLAWSAARGARDTARRCAVSRSRRRSAARVLPAVAVHPRRARHGAARHPRQPRDRRRSRRRQPGLLWRARARYGALLLFDTAGPIAALLARRSDWLWSSAGIRAHALAAGVSRSRSCSSSPARSRRAATWSRSCPFVALFAGDRDRRRSGSRQRLVGSAAVRRRVRPAGLESLRTGAFIRETDTRTLALDYIRAAHPGGRDDPDAAVLGAARADRGRPARGGQPIRAGDADEDARSKSRGRPIRHRPTG